MTAKIAPPANLTVAALAYDGLASFAFGIAVEVFGLPRPQFDPWCRFAVCAERRGDLRAVGGFWSGPQFDRTGGVARRA
jgi:AraC family transcriptional activator FtrA